MTENKKINVLNCPKSIHSLEKHDIELLGRIIDWMSNQEILSVFNVEEAAAYLRTTTRSLEYYAKRNKSLSYRLVGKNMVFKKEDLDDFLNRQLRPASNLR